MPRRSLGEESNQTLALHRSQHSAKVIPTEILSVNDCSVCPKDRSNQAIVFEKALASDEVDLVHNTERSSDQRDIPIAAVPGYRDVLSVGFEVLASGHPETEERFNGNPEQEDRNRIEEVLTSRP